MVKSDDSVFADQPSQIWSVTFAIISTRHWWIVRVLEWGVSATRERLSDYFKTWHGLVAGLLSWDCGTFVSPGRIWGVLSNFVLKRGSSLGTINNDRPINSIILWLLSQSWNDHGCSSGFQRVCISLWFAAFFVLLNRLMSGCLSLCNHTLRK